MADSDALRSRRKRAHASGDHALCKRCAGRSAVVALPVAAAAGTGIDPAVSLRALALRLERAHEDEPGNALLARELRVTLQAIGAPAEAGAGGGELARFLGRIRG